MCVLENPGNIAGLSSKVRKRCPCCLLVFGGLLGFSMLYLSDDGSVVSIVRYYLFNDLSFLLFIRVVQRVSVQSIS